MKNVRTVAILGCGWLGLPLGRHLHARGYRVHGATTSPEKLGVLSEAGLVPALVKVSPDTPPSGPASFFDADVLVLNIPPGRRDPAALAAYPACIASAIPSIRTGAIGHVIFAGSTSVYPDLNRKVGEGDAGPDGPNGAAVGASGEAMLAAEARLREAEGFDRTILRFAGLYGPGRQPGRFLAGRRGLNRGGAPVNLIHLDDCIGIIEAVIDAGPPVGTLNACSDEHPTRRAFYTAAAAALGLPAPHFEDDSAVPYKIVDNRRLKDRLGYRFKHPCPDPGGS